MKIWKVAALVALVAVPLILLSKKREEEQLPVAGDPDDIFSQELTEG